MAEERPPGWAFYTLSPGDLERIINMRRPSQWPALFFGPKIANAVQNFVVAFLQGGYIDNLKAHLYPMLQAGFDIAGEQAAAGPTGDSDALWHDIERLTGGLYDNWKAGIGVGMGAAFSSAMDDFLQTGQLIYAYKTLAYHIAITPRMRRHWNSIYFPEEFGASIAYILHRRGHLTYADFRKHAAWDGWSDSNADMLVRAMTSIPTDREAFYLWMKGQISEEQRNALYFATGWESEWWTRMTENWYYVPTLYDITRIADYVELDQIWALDAMKRRGVRESDRAKMWEMLQKRPFRTEYSALTSKMTWRYRMGHAIVFEPPDHTIQAVDNKLKEWGIGTKERELVEKKAILDYEDELVNEWIEIYIWYFRTARISEAEFFEELTDPAGNCRLKKEKANLIVELEKAKGYYGYY